MTPDLVHVAYGGVMAYLVTRAIRDRPVLVTYHASGLLVSAINAPPLAPWRSASASGIVARGAVTSRESPPSLGTYATRSRVARTTHASVECMHLHVGAKAVQDIDARLAKCEPLFPAWLARRDEHVLASRIPAKLELAFASIELPEPRHVNPVRDPREREAG